MRHKEKGNATTQIDVFGGKTSSFYYSDVRGISFRNVQLSNKNFYSCTFTNVDFRGCVLTNCVFDSSNFSFANFERSKLLSCSFKYSRFCGANLRETDLSKSTFLQANFDGVFVQNAIITADQIASVRGHIKMAGTWRHEKRFESCPQES